MDLQEKIQARRNERKQEEAQKREEENIEKHKAWIQSGGRNRLAKFTAKIILLPIYALCIAACIAAFLLAIELLKFWIF